MIRSEGLAVGEAARRGLDAAVPTCPGWDVGDLVMHLITVYESKQATVRDRPLGPPAPMPSRERPERSELLDAFDSALVAMVDTLSSADPDAQSWTWYPPQQTVRFWYRRMAHETAVHRLDAQLAHGVGSPFDPALAADGIDELLAVMLTRRSSPAASSPAASSLDAGHTQSLHLHSTDAPGEWLVIFGAGGLSVEAVHAKADAALRGPASELMSWAWGRRELDGLDSFGDREVLERFRAFVAERT